MSDGRYQAASSRCSSRTPSIAGEVGDRPGDPEEPLRPPAARSLEVGQADDPPLGARVEVAHGPQHPAGQPAIQDARRPCERERPAGRDPLPDDGGILRDRRR